MKRWVWGFGALLVAGPVLLAAALEASPGPVVNASFGLATAVGGGADQLGHGRTLAVDVTRGRGPTSHWILRSSYTQYDWAPASAGSGAALQFMNGGQLYAPVPVLSGGELTTSAFEGGLRRSFALGRVRLDVDGLAGTRITEYGNRARAILLNDRRPDLGGSAMRATPRDVTPTLSLGGGVEVRGPRRTAWTVAAAAEWSALRELDGPLIPIRFGARWPVDPPVAGLLLPPSPRAPRLRLAGGINLLGDPARLRDTMDPGVSASIDLELPIHPWLAVSLAGEHVVQRDQVPLARQETDSFGNLVNVDTGENLPLSLTATALTAGLRVSAPGRAVAPFVRAGAGWGRTGGFGSTVDASSGGAYLDQTGRWTPVTESTPVGGGEPADGFAYSASAGFETPLAGPARAFLEAGVLGIVLKHEDLRVMPIRLGVTLR